MLDTHAQKRDLIGFLLAMEAAEHAGMKLGPGYKIC